MNTFYRGCGENGTLLRRWHVCLFTQPCPTLCDPMDCSPSGSCPRGFSKQEYCSELPCPPPGDLPNPRVKLRPPALQDASLPSEPPGKPKNTGVGSLSLSKWNFLTQESNWGLLHPRLILHQLSYQGNPWTFLESVLSCNLNWQCVWVMFCRSWPLVHLRRWFTDKELFY